MKRFTISSLPLLAVWIVGLGVGYSQGDGSQGSCGNCLCIQYEFECNAGSNLGFSSSKTDASQLTSNAYGGKLNNWGMTCLESGFGETNNTIYTYSYGTLDFLCDIPAGVNPPYVQQAEGGTMPAYFGSSLQGNCGGGGGGAGGGGGGPGTGGPT